MLAEARFNILLTDLEEPNNLFLFECDGLNQLKDIIVHLLLSQGEQVFHRIC